MNKNISYIKAVFLDLRLLIKSTKETYLFIFVCLINGLLSGAVILVSAYFFQIIQEIGKNTTISFAIMAILSYAITMIINEIANGLTFYQFEVPRDSTLVKASIEYKKLLINKINKVNPILFENQDFMDKVNKNLKVMPEHIRVSLYIILEVFFYLTYFLFITFYVFTLSKNLVFLMVLIIIPMVIGEYLKIKILGNTEVKLNNVRRKRDYLQSTIISREYSKDTRALVISNILLNKLKNTVDEYCNKGYKAEIKSAYIKILSDIIYGIGYFLMVGLLAYNLYKRNITVAQFVAVITNIGLMFLIANEAINNAMKDISKNIIYLKEYWEFISLEEINYKDVPQDLDRKIICKDVSFSYDNKKVVLDKVSFTINKNETIAIVGENGSGKTTLTKLIMGIYTPTSGELIVSGIKSKKENLRSIRKLFTCVCQNFQKYKLSSLENITISESFEENIKEVYRACNNADFVAYKDFKNGLETILSIEFGKKDLSGGQWQRLSMARGLYRNRDFVVIDEPTAFIDPVEESKVYKKIVEISKNKTAIIVTHRLGAAKIADRIIVLNNGKIEDIGSHKELISKNGTYKKLYESQEKWYI